MPTNGKTVSYHLIYIDNAGEAAIEVCKWLNETKATLVAVSQIVVERRLITTVFYT